MAKIELSKANMSAMCEERNLEGEEELPPMGKRTGPVPKWPFPIKQPSSHQAPATAEPPKTTDKE